jgi:sigma-B regulation protein RsbQ
VASRLQGIHFGANDFLVRPFEPAELVNRVHALLLASKPKSQRVRFANLEIDLEARTCWRNGKSVQLTRTEFALFVALLRRPAQVLSRAALFDEVWRTVARSEDNVLEVTMRRLRVKLDNPFEVKLLHTVRGVGYMLDDRSTREPELTAFPQGAPHQAARRSALDGSRSSPRVTGRVSLQVGQMAENNAANGMRTDVWRRNNAWVSGSGPATIIFAHGFGCDQTMWRLMAPLFRGRFRTVLFDHVGSGGSDLSAYEPRQYNTLQKYADDINELLDEVASRQVVFVGHSVSAMIGMLADLAKPGRIVGHVMIGPSPCYVNDGDYIGGFERADIDELLSTLKNNYLGWSKSMAPVIMGAPDRPALGRELADSFCRTNPEIAEHFARVTFLSDYRDRLPELQTPSLILQCDDDVIAPTTVGAFMHQVMPRSILRVIENIGHCPHLSAPGVCIESMEEFLSTVC